ncbi:transposase, partial [Streptomyces sp. WM6386]|uniref:transposase n=1 Tax=Streptomyces sp. WM6386 TaxID=1415558 RepID=UPI0006192784
MTHKVIGGSLQPAVRPSCLPDVGVGLAHPVGLITAAQILVSWSHPGRFRSEAAFASFAGVSPIPASCGLTNRRRINRSGDRQLNRALHT